MEENFRNTVIKHYENNQWSEILKLNEDSANEVARNLLWVWPSDINLNFIKHHIQNNGLKGITSLGCGCGLLEWLIQTATGISVIGLEVNETWWKSKYSNPQFIPLQFPNLPPTSDTLREDYAILFCYFNNGPAFQEYVNSYRGNLIIIIGPGEGRGTVTNPEPFQVKFDNNCWHLYDSQEVKSTKDFIAIYRKSNSSQQSV